MAWLNIKRWRKYSKQRDVETDLSYRLEEVTPHLQTIRRDMRYLERHYPRQFEALRQSEDYRAFKDLIKKVGIDL